MTELQRIVADATQVTVGRDDIVLLFGMERSAQTGGDEVVVEASDRIVLRPLTAKRLSELLRRVVDEHEQEFVQPNDGAPDPVRRAAEDSTAPDRHRPNIRWDGTLTTSSYVNAVEVTRSREAIEILFGVEQVRQAGQREIQIEPSRHLALIPPVAEQLATGLEEAISHHGAESSAQKTASAVPGSEQDVEAHPVGDASDEHLEKILTLFRQLGTLDVPIDFEQSFKAAHGQLFEDRFLLGVNRREAERGPGQAITSIGEKIGMPRNLLASFKESLPDANHVYFGVERSEQTLIFKAYLEFRDRIEKEIDGIEVAGRSFPLFTGYKWDTSAPSRQAVTQYAWYPSLPVPEILDRLRMTIDSSAHHELFEIARGLIEGASEKIPHGDIQFLEVTEEGNSRSSFDFNLYKAGYRLEDLSPFLSKAVAHYALPAERIQALYDRIKNERFGHLAGGVDRDKRDFMTVYYGVAQIDASQLASAQIAPGNDPS